MKVLLVDDHVLFREGLVHLLDGLDPALEFAEADSVAGALAHPGAVDLILLDMHLRGPNGTEALAAVRTGIPGATIVVVSGDEDPLLIRRCIELGASGFIPKSSTRSVLISALRLVIAGGVYLPAAVLGRDAWREPAIAADNPGARTQEAARLSARQLEVLRMAIRGKANKVIAREMSLSEGTVKQHLSSAFRALGVANRTEAVYRAAELGIELAPQRGAPAP